MGIKLPDSKLNQDVPPSGKFPKIQFSRTNRARGMSGAGIFLTVAVMTAYGFYMVNKTNKDTAMRVLVNREAAMSLRPYFEAEVDLNYLLFLRHQEELMREHMKDVKGWEYKSNNYTSHFQPPVYGIRDNNINEIIKKHKEEDSRK